MKVIKSYSLDKEVADWLSKGEYTTASKKLNAIILEAMREEKNPSRVFIGFRNKKTAGIVYNFSEKKPIAFYQGNPDWEAIYREKL